MYFAKLDKATQEQIKDIEKKYPYMRETDVFQNEFDIQIDVTSSCDVSEQQHAMESFVKRGLKDYQQDGSLLSASRVIAAHDLMMSVQKSYGHIKENENMDNKKYKFINASFYDMFYAENTGEKAPFWTGVLAYEVDGNEDAFYDDGEFTRLNKDVRFKVLKMDEYNEKVNSSIGRGYDMGEYIYFADDSEYDRMKINEVYPDDDKRCLKLNEQFDEYRANAPYRVSGCLYSEEPTYYSWDDKKQYPKYDKIEGTDKEWTLTPRYLAAFTREEPSIDAAEKWLLSEHPDYWMGASIVQDCRGGSFSMHAVPGIEYGEGKYETHEARYEYARDLAFEKGVETVAESEIEAVRNLSYDHDFDRVNEDDWMDLR